MRETPVVKPSNTGCKFVFFLLGIPLFLGFLIIESLLVYSTLRNGDVSTLVIVSTSLAVITLVPFLILTVLLRQGVRYNRRRQAAAQRDPTALTYPQQPIANPQMPTLPMTITLFPTAKLRWLMSLISTVTLAGIIIGSWSNLIPFRGWLSVFAVISLALFVRAIIAMIFKHPALQINVTDKEIQITQFGEESSVEWEDARLFAVFAVRRHGDDIRYELSSEQVIMCWNWDRSPRSVRFTTSVEEYNRKMEELLAIIVAKTGLTLYDLR
jgi:hypothetical protein